LIVFPSNGECSQPTLLPLNILSKDLIITIIIGLLLSISFPERVVQIDINNKVMEKQVAMYYILFLLAVRRRIELIALDHADIV
jgi:hypothetical protein